MLTLYRVIALFILCVSSGAILACSSGHNDEYKKSIEKNLLGKDVYSLYENFGFQKLEVDNEYADLRKNEKYWLAVDSNFEYLTLRTEDNIVRDIIIRNPDFQTEQGAYVGISSKEFKKIYPNAKQLARYQGSVKKQISIYCIQLENLEVEVVQGKVFTIRVLDECGNNNSH